MSATDLMPPEVAAYLDQVRAALADLPAEERDELLADLEISLLEEPGAAPEQRLGPPARFAQELRAAAGLESAPEPPAAVSLWARMRPRLGAARATALELAPAWWILRGYVAACAVALFGGFNWSEAYALVPVRGAPQFGVLLVLAGVAASVWLGRKRLRGRWIVALNVALAVVTVPIAIQAVDGRASLAAVDSYYAEPTVQEGLSVRGEHIRNIYPYDRNGKLLLDVLLYDDLGRPLEIGSADQSQDPMRRMLTTKDGAPVLNAFPIRYFEPGTQKVAEPEAAPEGIEVPDITTPPLKRP